MKRMLVLIQGRSVAASRYRILQYLPYFEEAGMVSDVLEFPSGIKEYHSLLKVLGDYDVVFVQRKRFHFPFLGAFSRKAKRVIFDLDDSVMYKNSLAPSPDSRTRMRRFANMARISDVIVAGNSFLREKSLPFNENVVVIPTSIPAGRYSLKDYSIAKEKVTIGWIGDHGSIHYLEEMKSVWEEIGRRFPGRVELKIICDTFFDLENMPVRKVSWSSETEVEELKDIDIGVMPLADDPWSWGKCGLKILQYCGVGIPSVCTPVGVNSDVVADGVSGCWASNPSEWIDGISMLVEDADLRQKMGIEARKRLDMGFTLEANAPRLLCAVKGDE